MICFEGDAVWFGAGHKGETGILRQCKNKGIVERRPEAVKEEVRIEDDWMRFAQSEMFQARLVIDKMNYGAIAIALEDQIAM